MNPTIADIQKQLFEFQDLEYKAFHSKLMPNINPSLIIGIRVPVLRKYAKQLSKQKEAEVFLNSLPHTYYEENNLHAFLVSECNDYNKVMAYTEGFLPYIDNWATCDSFSPKVFGTRKNDLLPSIYRWITSAEPYTIRFGIEMLMRHYLDEDFRIEYPVLVASVHSEEYYVNMMIAWYFATALAKQYGAILPFICEQKLDVWTHNKAIQKAIESYRITPEQKEYLRALKIR